MKIDSDFEVLPVAEAAGLFLNRLNRRIQSFADGVGDPVLKEGRDIFQKDKKFLFGCAGWVCILVLIFSFNHRQEI